MSERGESLIPRFLPWAALGAYALACVLWWVEDAWYPEWDSAIYLLTARSIAEGEGYSYLGRPFFLRPPGFSWLLSFFVKDGGFDFGRVNTLVMALAASSVVAVYLALRAHGRKWLALGAALLAGTSPLFVASFNWVQSEYLFATLFFLAVAALRLGLDPRPRWWGWGLAGAVALSAAIHVRTVGVLLLPALVVVAVLRRDGALKRALLPLGLTAASLVPWTLYTRAATLEAERPSEQLYLFDYGTALFREDPGDPESPRIDLAGWQERIASNGAAMARAFARTVLGSEATWAVVLVLALLAAGAVLAALSGLGLIAWFSVFGGALLLAYFTYADRLLVPLVPCAYALALVALERGLRAASRALGRPRLVAQGAAAAFGALLLVNALRMPASMDPHAGASAEEERALYWQDLAATGRWLREHTPEDAVVLCNQAPILSLLSGRRAYTYRFQRTPDLLAKYGVDYVVFDGAYPVALGEFVGRRLKDVWRIPARGLPQDIGVARVR